MTKFVPKISCLKDRQKEAGAEIGYLSHEFKGPNQPQANSLQEGRPEDLIKRLGSIIGGCMGGGGTPKFP